MSREAVQRTFEVDVLRCDKCGGQGKVVAFIPSGARARQILERLGIDATAPQIPTARALPKRPDWHG